MLQELSAVDYAVALFGAFSLGIAKTGLPGLALLNVVIMAEIFGAKASVGIVLPLLIVCDLIVYPMFRRHASWRDVLPLIPSTVVGVACGALLLGSIDDIVARRIIGGIILLMLALQLARASGRRFLARLPDSRVFRATSGLTIGVSTMLANAAGPVFSIYALVHRMAKNDFIGIGARFFLCVNAIKIPFAAGLGILDGHALRVDLLLLPGIVAGILLGRHLIRVVPQRVFEILLYALSAVAAIRMLRF